MRKHRRAAGTETAQPCQDAAFFYGTSAPQQAKNSHTGLIVCLCLLVILLCSLQLLVLFKGVHFVRKDGVLRLEVGKTEEQTASEQEQQTIRTKTELPPDGERCCDTPSLVLRDGDAAELTEAERYAGVNPAVVCVLDEQAGYSVCQTGVILSENGYVLCCCEKPQQALTLRCILADGTECPAAYLGSDAETGLSLLRLRAEDLPTLRFGSAERVAVGQEVLSIGNPNGTLLRNAMQSGVVTAVGRQTQLDDTELTLLQTSAEFSSGELGCPIVDGRGLVIGITTSIPGLWTEGTIAVASDDLQAAVDRILAENCAARLELGVDVGEIPSLLVSYYGFPGTLWIRNVTDPEIEAAGLFAYDVIVRAGGETVNSWEEFNAAVAAAGPGEPLELVIYRAGQYYRAWLAVAQR